MKVDLDKPFKGINGNNLSGGESMRNLLAQSLFNGAGIQNNAGEKFAAYKLCNRLISEKGELELDKDERKLLRATACEYLTPGAFGQVIDLIGND